MTHPSPQRPAAKLCGKRVRLDRFTELDASPLAKMSQDIETMRQVESGTVFPLSVADQTSLIQSMNNSRTSRSFAVRPLHTDELLGEAGLSSIEHRHRHAEIGIRLAREHQGQGLGTEAIELLLAFAFDELNLYRVGLGAFSFNTGALALYRRLGFQHEGEQRAWGWRDGRPFGLVTLSLLEPEYRARNRI